MHFGAVGIKCPDHAGGPAKTHAQHRPAARMKRAATQRPMSLRNGIAPVTRLLIAINVLIYLAELATGAGFNGDSGWIFNHFSLMRDYAYCGGGICYPNGSLASAGVAHGEWWRLITSAFLHFGPLHLGMNMLGLWWLGASLEEAIGSRRYAMLYVVAGLAGAAGALVATPNQITVGASGAIFGIMGATLVLQYLATGSFAGPALTLIIVNVAFSFAVSNISIGGHIGGLIGGVVAGGAMARFGRGHMAYGKLGIVGFASLTAIGLIAVLVAYVKIGLL